MNAKSVLRLLAPIILLQDFAHGQQQDQPQQGKPEQISQANRTGGRNKARGKRVVAELSRFDLVDPSRVRNQTAVVGAPRGLSQPLALAARLGSPVLACSYAGQDKNRVLALRYDAQEKAFRSAAMGSPPEPGTLELGKPLEREMKSGESHSYRANLKAGEFMHVVVDQKGIDAIVAIIGPGGKVIAEMDSLNGAWGPEQVSVLAEASGSYSVEIRSLDKKASVGRYQVTVTDLRPPRREDRTRIRAERAYAGGIRLKDGTSEEEKEAISNLQEALSLYQAISDRYGQAAALFYQRALAMREKVLGPGHSDVATSLNALATLYSAQTRYGEAEPSFQRALAISERMEPVIMNCRGHVATKGKLPNIPPAKEITKLIELRLNNVLLDEPSVERGWLVFKAQPNQFAVGKNLVGLRVTKRPQDARSEILVEKLAVYVRYRQVGQK